VYEKAYNSIKELEIEEKYITKYGEPNYPLPDGIARKEKQRLKREKNQAKALALKEKKAAKKAKLDAKEAKLSAKAEKSYQKALKLKEKEDKKQERYKKLQEKYNPKPTPVKDAAPTKRKRRTKAEMEASRVVLSPAKQGTIPPEVAKEAVRVVSERRKKIAEEADFSFNIMPEAPKDNVINMKVLKKRTKVYEPIKLDNFFD
jgi:hypothetical protein